MTEQTIHKLTSMTGALHSFRRFVLSKNFVVQYIVSILTGFSNLLSLTFFGNLFTEPATYSSVATVLSTFSSYFVFLELGYNAELTRDFDNPQTIGGADGIVSGSQGRSAGGSQGRREASGFLSLLYFRWIITCVLVGTAFFQGFFSGLGKQGSMVFGVFSLSFFVYSLLATFDSYYWAKGEASRSISVKIVRIFVAISLPAMLYFFPTQDLVSIFTAYSCFVLVLGAGMVFLKQSLLKRVFAEGYFPEKDYFKSFALRCLKSAAPPGLSLLGVLLMQTVLFKSHGVGNLASYVAAMSLLAPITIALQTVCQLVLKDLTFFTQNDLLSVGKHIRKANTLILFIGIIGILAVLALYKLGIVGIFLKHLDGSFVWIWTAIAFQNIFLAMQVQGLNFLQLRQRYRGLFLAAIVLFSLTTASVGYCTFMYGLVGYVWSTTAAAFFGFLMIHQISRREYQI